MVNSPTEQPTVVHLVCKNFMNQSSMGLSKDFNLVSTKVSITITWSSKIVYMNLSNF